ncbi:MAG: hypothetical protein V4568_02020 [Pseudomonadota bacterium]
MDDINEKIRKFSLLRIAKVFNVSVDSLRKDSKFGEGNLQASTAPSLFKRMEHDYIEDDIYNAADRKIYKEISSGNLTIHTVDDYCNHMIRCYEIKPTDVKRVLGMD